MTKKCDVISDTGDVLPEYDLKRKYMEEIDEEFLVENLIKSYEEGIEDLVEKKTVFSCPECLREFRDSENYRKMQLCYSCYYEEETRRLKKNLKTIIGSKITQIDVGCSSAHPPECGIKKIYVKTKKGKEIIIDDPPFRVNG